MVSLLLTTLDINFFISTIIIKKIRIATSYLLLAQGASIPSAYQHLPIIRTPVQKIVLMSTTQVALFDVLDTTEVIIGLSNPKYVWNPRVKKLIQKGEIIGVRQPSRLNLEQVLKLKSDVVIAVGFPDMQYQTYGVLENAGIPVIYNAEWQERSILGRAEWMKVAAVLLNQEAKCEAIFNRTVVSYDSLKKLTVSVTHKPTVVCNVPRKGVWHIPGGRSYVAELIQDAGANFPWGNNPNTGSRVIGFEEVYEVGIRADIWLNAGLCQDLSGITDVDARLSDFQPFKTQHVYVNIKRWHPEKGNSYWETGIVSPHLILADLIHIIHPNILSNPELYFYQKL